MGAPGTRLDPLDPGRWSDATRAVLGGSVAPVSELEGGPSGGGAKPLNILRTIAHHPTLLEPFLAFAATLATRGVLPRRDHELLALRAAWNGRSPFEWGHHALYAQAAGLSDDEIERVARGAAAEGWSQREQLLLASADELAAAQDVSDETWSRLREHFDEAQLVEIPFVVGQYTMLSMLANMTGVPVEDELPPLPEV